MRNLISALALSLLALAATAQEPTGAPETTDTGPPAVAVETAPVVRPVPLEGATPAEVAAVEEQAEKNLEAVAEGEITIEEATRDPEESVDSGESTTFWLLTLLYGAIFSPIVAVLVEKVKAIDNRLTQPVAALGLVVFYLAAFFLLARGNPSLPQEWEAWIAAAFMGAGAGAISSGAVRSLRGGA